MRSTRSGHSIDGDVPCSPSIAAPSAPSGPVRIGRATPLPAGLPTGGEHSGDDVAQNGTSGEQALPSARPDRIRQNSMASRVSSSPPSPLDEVAAGGPGEVSVNGLAVAAGPLGHDVGDDAAVVVGGQLHRPAGGRATSTRCIQVSRVRMMSNR